MDDKQPIRILILDDEPIVCQRLQPVLEKKGYYVEAFYQSENALKRFKETPFHIVVTDLKMKGLDGMQFLTEVKKTAPETEVIVITGFATMETAKESFRKGVFDFLAKPFKLGEIQEAIQNAEKKFRENANR
ncbi:MAG: response regulator [Deltaproteobacteria bacterium CG1_02_45_11]|nr:MAG: response regulator [Deltaproteobacteria bacterium CG1_02_45_11]HCW75687.1 response regulator [Candidatus Neomarinimicrobiota bacterium]